MPDQDVPALNRPRIERFLAAHGAEGMPHPGGTLLEHLVRVREQLAAWAAGPTVQAAGLCHAAYGTDGFAETLLDLADRDQLSALIGPAAESLVYFYGSCDRAAVYPRLGTAGPLTFRDRFTGAEYVPTDVELRGFMEITAANELDVLAHNPELAAKYGPSMRRLFTRARGLLSAAAWEACDRQTTDGHIS
jgi:hypothetical protein